MISFDHVPNGDSGDLMNLGDRILEVLELIDNSPEFFAREADKRGISLNQLRAAALAQMVEEMRAK